MTFNYYSQRSIHLMASAMEDVIVKNRSRFRWRKLSRTNAAKNNNSIQQQQQPRHFASKTNPLKKASTSNTTTSTTTTAANSTPNYHHPLVQSFIKAQEERDAKILFGIPTLLVVVGYYISSTGTTNLFDKDYWWSIVQGAFPLATILTGFGMLGRENYRLEDNNNGKKFVLDDNDNKDDENDTVPRLLHHSSTSSLSSTDESTETVDTSTTSSSIDYHAEQTISMEGIEVPEGCTVDGTFLDRHGSGLRCFAFFRGISVSVYVATLYSSESFVDGQDVLEYYNASSFDTTTTAPLQMDFTFLRGFTAGQCRLAWQKQLDESVSHRYRYDGFEHDKQEFLAKIATESMKANGTVTVQIHEDKTLIFDQGRYTGEIIGKDFQLAFLSMWFGDKPVTADLKARLLGQEE